METIIHREFVFINVTENAKEIFNSGLFELFRLEDDKNESSINNFDELNSDLDQGYKIGLKENVIMNFIDEIQKDSRFAVIICDYETKPLWECLFYYTPNIKTQSRNRIIETVGKDRIKTVYESVIKFIKWYNANK